MCIVDEAGQMTLPVALGPILHSKYVAPQFVHLLYWHAHAVMLCCLGHCCAILSGSIFAVKGVLMATEERPSVTNSGQMACIRIHDCNYVAYCAAHTVFCCLLHPDIRCCCLSMQLRHQLDRAVRQHISFDIQLHGALQCQHQATLMALQSWPDPVRYNLA